MSTRNWWSCVAVLVALHPLIPTKASGQTTTDQVVHACYIPSVGVIYRIKAAGLPSACLAKTHVEFEWNVKGDPGNLALAGQSCAAGAFISGFSATGTLVCAASQGGGDASVLLGPWNNVTTRVTICRDGSAFAFPETMRVTSSQVGQVTLNFTGSISGPSALNIQVNAPGTVAVPQPLVFPFVVSAQGSTSVESAMIVGRMNWTIDGQFNSATDFQGRAGATLEFTSQGQSFICSVGQVPELTTR